MFGFQLVLDQYLYISLSTALHTSYDPLTVSEINSWRLKLPTCLSGNTLSRASSLNLEQSKIMIINKQGTNEVISQ